MRRSVPDGHTVAYVHKYKLAVFNHFVTDAVEGTRGHAMWSGYRFTTRATVLGPAGEMVATAEAICRPEDQFSRKVGRDISLGRALKSLEPPPRCGKMLLGSGPWARDPECELPEGHDGTCRSRGAIDQHRWVEA